MSSIRLDSDHRLWVRASFITIQLQLSDSATTKNLPYMALINLSWDLINYNYN